MIADARLTRPAAPRLARTPERLTWLSPHSPTPPIPEGTQTVPRVTVERDPRVPNRLLLRYETEIVGTLDVRGAGREELLIRDRTQNHAGRITGLDIEVLHPPGATISFDLWRRSFANAGGRHGLRELKVKPVEARRPLPNGDELQLWPPGRHPGPIRRPEVTPEERAADVTAKADWERKWRERHELLAPEYQAKRRLDRDLGSVEYRRQLLSTDRGVIELILGGRMPDRTWQRLAQKLLDQVASYHKVGLPAKELLSQAEQAIAAADAKLDAYRDDLIGNLDTTIAGLRKTAAVGELVGKSIPGPWGRAFTIAYAVTKTATQPPLGWPEPTDSPAVRKKKLDRITERLNDAHDVFGALTGLGALSGLGGGGPPGGPRTGKAPTRRTPAPDTPAARPRGLATPDEDVLIRQYVKGLSDLREARRGLDDPNGPKHYQASQQRYATVNKTLDDIERQAGAPTPTTGQLVDHLKPLTVERAKLQQQGGANMTETGTRVQAAALNKDTKNLRGRDYADIRNAIGRDPDHVDPGTQVKPSEVPKHSRVTWFFPDRSRLVIDYPAPLKKADPSDPRHTRPASADQPHAEIHGPNRERLDQQGIVVPERSISSHMTITDNTGALASLIAAARRKPK